ncbi:heptaprenyl diphosphate synthase component 1 [Effusibacillus lacus]|uniref:Heptaprenyl diphosphate synthase n=1 Tax=Effusibacillus lacus TaxID=1348429 RepID=A0A292YLD5_9BACL|nr:heptaprenyl diphosphate synthase component 1 [Effusibacillus lacus]TCS75281.1 heptaprenyl diphosphate synthase subunit 1 [Effusibacillus lacus]GAX89719.1 hypothetical protein EFBL_1344 [Effusibacillus lacus]
MIIEQTDREHMSLRMCGQVLSEMHHSYLTKLIGLPNPELFQLNTALSILRTAGCSGEETELLATALMLIYHGLSVHEQIEETHADATQQLKVLAGDYYSSKYFYLLASWGQVDKIGLFAEAIARINEAKAERFALFQKERSNTDKYLFLCERIEGELLYVLCSQYLQGKPVVADLVRMLVRTYVMGNEYNQFLSGEYNRNFSHVYLTNRATEDELANAFLQETKVMTLHVKYGTSGFMFNQLEAGLMTVRQLLSIQESPVAVESFSDVIEFLNDMYLQPRKNVEEG